MLILQMQMSVDGFVDSAVPASSWQLWDWSASWPWSADLRHFFNEQFDEADAILISRPMADEGYLDHWRSVAASHPDEPDWGFARRIVELPKFAASRSGRRPEHPDVAFPSGELPDIVRGVGRDRRILCFGGAGLARSLLSAGLVDELQLFVNPGFAGAGNRIFDVDLAGRRAPGVAARAFECGVVVARWRLATATG